ncbi:hypothetical protein IE53DRAFT_408545 [Violaceomyces palustris]|uniref:Uncharacterized protein n=1 Tax=Violaceomyces palustris TaxID=1673888 RepID=A0ACD0P6I0_9BASI|nr:hypothetical protein IE53DRAFT_408545 [Violaceomyces palustris]
MSALSVTRSFSYSERSFIKAERNGRFSQTLLASPAVSSFTTTLENQTPRSIVLCFDGTGDSFDKDNSNIVKFFSSLKKGDPNQLVYYQPGIGMYDERGNKGFGIESAVDMAFGTSINRHIIDGYRFLMQEYKAKDIVSILGFSRGAYTARALAAMVNTVGLLPAFNAEQMGFAFRIYKDSFKNLENAELARGFRETFSIPIQIHFVGCFDTVSSVGLIPRSLPGTKADVDMKYFRHALALDEHRGKFRQRNWISRKARSQAAGGGSDEDSVRTQVDVNGSDVNDSSKELAYATATASRAPQVKEVWFSGCHADVGIIFDKLALYSYGFRDFESLINPPKEERSHREVINQVVRATSLNNFLKDRITPDKSSLINIAASSAAEEELEEVTDALTPINDQLHRFSPWWILEFWPVRRTVDFLIWGKRKILTRFNVFHLKLSSLNAIPQRNMCLSPNRGRYRVTNEPNPVCHWTSMLRASVPSLKYEIKVALRNPKAIKRGWRWED